MMEFYEQPVVTAVNDTTVYAEHHIVVSGMHFKNWNETLCFINGKYVNPTWTQCGLLCQIPQSNPGMINVSVTNHYDDPIVDFFEIQVTFWLFFLMSFCNGK